MANQRREINNPSSSLPDTAHPETGTGIASNLRSANHLSHFYDPTLAYEEEEDYDAVIKKETTLVTPTATSGRLDGSKGQLAKDSYGQRKHTRFRSPEEGEETRYASSTYKNPRDRFPGNQQAAPVVRTTREPMADPNTMLHRDQNRPYKRGKKGNSIDVEASRARRQEWHDHESVKDQENNGDPATGHPPYIDLTDKQHSRQNGSAGKLPIHMAQSPFESNHYTVSSPAEKRVPLSHRETGYAQFATTSGTPAHGDSSSIDRIYRPRKESTEATAHGTLRLKKMPNLAKTAGTFGVGEEKRKTSIKKAKEEPIDLDEPIIQSSAPTGLTDRRGSASPYKKKAECPMVDQSPAKAPKPTAKLNGKSPNKQHRILEYFAPGGQSLKPKKPRATLSGMGASGSTKASQVQRTELKFQRIPSDSSNTDSGCKDSLGGERTEASAYIGVEHTGHDSIYHISSPFTATKSDLDGKSTHSDDEDYGDDLIDLNVWEEIEEKAIAELQGKKLAGDTINGVRGEQIPVKAKTISLPDDSADPWMKRYITPAIGEEDELMSTKEYDSYAYNDAASIKTADDDDDTSRINTDDEPVPIVKARSKARHGPDTDIYDVHKHKLHRCHIDNPDIPNLVIQSNGTLVIRSSLVLAANLWRLIESTASNSKRIAKPTGTRGEIACLSDLNKVKRLELEDFPDWGTGCVIAYFVNTAPSSRHDVHSVFPKVNSVTIQNRGRIGLLNFAGASDDETIELHARNLAYLANPSGLCFDYNISTFGNPGVGYFMQQLKAAWPRLCGISVHQALDEVPFVLPGVEHQVHHVARAFPFSSGKYWMPPSPEGKVDELDVEMDNIAECHSSGLEISGMTGYNVWFREMKMILEYAAGICEATGGDFPNYKIVVPGHDNDIIERFETGLAKCQASHKFNEERKWDFWKARRNDFDINKVEVEYRKWKEVQCGICNFTLTDPA